MNSFLGSQYVYKDQQLADKVNKTCNELKRSAANVDNNAVKTRYQTVKKDKKFVANINNEKVKKGQRLVNNRNDSGSEPQFKFKFDDSVKNRTKSRYYQIEFQGDMGLAQSLNKIDRIINSEYKWFDKPQSKHKKHTGEYVNNNNGNMNNNNGNMNNNNGNVNVNVNVNNNQRVVKKVEILLGNEQKQKWEECRLNGSRLKYYNNRLMKYQKKIQTLNYQRQMVMKTVL